MNNDKSVVKTPEQIPDPYKEAVKQHEPSVGDVYLDARPSCNGAGVFRIVGKEDAGNGTVRWRIERITGFGLGVSRTIGDGDLKRYYRPLLNGYDDILALAEKVCDGEMDEVAALVGLPGGTPASGEELMATESPEHIRALLDASQSVQNKIEEVKLMADTLIEIKKAEMEDKLREMDRYLGVVRKKVGDIAKVISILNLYIGRTVELHHIASGEGAPAGEPLSLRQRILFMDEELCVHLDHEADYRDVPAFFEWVKDSVNRDIVIPEERSVVALKPKRLNMNYRSNDPVYDNIRNEWNKHTYILLRNGENLYWAESDDLEVYDWAFPHEDFVESYEKKVAEDRYRKDNIIREYESVRFRVTRYMMFLQGIIEQRPDVIGTPSVRPNLVKLEGVRLVRDDENLIGTGRKPWYEFLKEKNALIRRGTRILYLDGGYSWYQDLGGRYRREKNGGDFVRYYRYESSEPEMPATGVYSADTVDVVARYVDGKPVKKTADYLVFRYMPGDKVFERTAWDEHERKQRVAWRYASDHVINYDGVTVDELRGYMEDRTQRKDFAHMMPILKKTLLMKEAEKRDEEAFKTLLAESVFRECGRRVSGEEMDGAVEWWKGKVIFSRPLRSDDAKAWRMIRSRLIGKGD